MTYAIPRKFVHISSIDRLANETPSKFTIFLQMSVKCSKCRLIEACIPNSYYNITNSNNGIKFGSVLYQIRPGSYDLAQLLAQLQTTCTFITSVVFDDVNCYLVITTSTSQTMSFPATGSLNNVLGFPITYNSTGTLFYGSNSPSVDQFSVFIEIDELSNSMLTSNFKNSTFVISNNVNKNGIIYYYQQSQFDQAITPRQPDYPIQTLHVSVKDIYGNICVGLTEWSLLLELS